MLGFGIGEIILIIVVAIIVLGPDKLPNALIEMAKFIRVVKRTMQDAKETIDREVNLAEIKKEAEAYKAKLEQSADISKDIKDANLIGEIQKDMNDIQHLFQDYQPKPVQIDESPTQKSSTDSLNQDSLQPNKQSTHSQNTTAQESAPTINQPQTSTSNHIAPTNIEDKANADNIRGLS